MADTQTGETNEEEMLRQSRVHVGGPILLDSKTKAGQNNVTVSVSLSRVSVTEAPGNVYLTIKD